MRTARRPAPAHWKWERDILLQGASVRASRYSARNFSFILGALTALLATTAPSMTETAAANGDTRTINLFYVHTGESISATYLVNGQYNPAALQQLNWFLRDWRHNEPIEMDPRLFDVVWEAYRSAGAEGEVVTVVSAYRSPQTNAMLRARSRSVAKFSQHMLGKAMDTTMPGMPMSRIREIGMRMQRGGVGYYPTAGTPFVHLDVGNVRAWPRMSYDQLVRLFPDGKTVHLPSNGQPLARYDEAKAEIEARNNGAIVVAPRKSSGGFFAFLFGGGEDEGEDAAPAPAPSTRKQWAQLAPRNSRAAKIAAAESDEEGGGEAPAETRRSAVIAKAQANLPRGETVMTAAPDDKPLQPPPREKPVAVNAPLPPGRPASLDKPTPIEPASRGRQARRLGVGRARGRRQILARQSGRTGAGIGERRRRADALERALAAAPAAGFGRQFGRAAAADAADGAHLRGERKRVARRRGGRPAAPVSAQEPWRRGARARRQCIGDPDRRDGIGRWPAGDDARATRGDARNRRRDARLCAAGARPRGDRRGQASRQGRRAAHELCPRPSGPLEFPGDDPDDAGQQNVDGLGARRLDRRRAFGRPRRRAEHVDLPEWRRRDALLQSNLGAGGG